MGGGTRLTIDDIPEVRISRQIGHQTFHPLDACNEVDDLLFIGLLVQSSNNVIHGLPEDGRETMTHGGVGEGILMVPSIRRPGGVLCQRATTSDGVERSREVSNLRVDLGRGPRPGSTSTVPPFWEVGEREGNLLGCARTATTGLRRSSKDGGFVVWVGSKVVVSHSAFFLSVG